MKDLDLSEAILASFEAENAPFIDERDVLLVDDTPMVVSLVPHVVEPKQYVSFEEIKRRLGEA